MTTLAITYKITRTKSNFQKIEFNDKYKTFCSLNELPNGEILAYFTNEHFDHHIKHRDLTSIIIAFADFYSQFYNFDFIFVQDETLQSVTVRLDTRQRLFLTSNYPSNLSTGLRSIIDEHINKHDYQPFAPDIKTPFN